MDCSEGVCSRAAARRAPCLPRSNDSPDRAQSAVWMATRLHGGPGRPGTDSSGPPSLPPPRLSPQGTLRLPCLANGPCVASTARSSQKGAGKPWGAGAGRGGPRGLAPSRFRGAAARPDSLSPQHESGRGRRADGPRSAETDHPPARICTVPRRPHRPRGRRSVASRHLEGGGPGLEAGAGRSHRGANHSLKCPGRNAETFRLRRRNIMV